MNAADVSRAVAAARAIAAGLGLRAHDAVVLHNSNKLAVRLSPCEVLARIAPAAHQHLQFEIALAGALAGAGSPVAALAPGIAARVHEQGGFAVSLWTYYPSASAPVSAGDYASALRQLHAGMRGLDITGPHFTDRAQEAQDLVANHDLTPALNDADRRLLADALLQLRQAIVDRHAPEQLLHGEPHPGNLLATESGPRFIDFETCCRGPVEFDLAHVPRAVSALYPGADPALLSDCQGLVVAMIAAWRWDARDEFPDGERAGRDFIQALRRGPPWLTLDEWR